MNDKNIEEKHLTLWDFFRYSRDIDTQFASIRLMNLLRCSFTDNDMKNIPIANMQHMDIMRMRNGGMKSANEFDRLKSEFMNKNLPYSFPILTQYKEALRDCLEALQNIADPIEYLRKEVINEKYSFDLRGAVEFANNGMSVSNMAIEALEKLKAKQLLNNE